MMKRLCPLAALLTTILGACVGFALAADPKPHVVMLINEDEYKADKTLPAFAKMLEEKHGCRTTVLDGQRKDEINGLEALDTADLMVVFIRRHGLPKEQMARVRKYLEAGKPLVALRTSCHAFAFGANKTAPAGVEQWPEFDVEVLGCHYHGHGPNQKGTQVSFAKDAAEHPILRGMHSQNWHSAGSLYYVLPLDKKTTVLLVGKVDDREEPIAWAASYKGGRVFYTSLGHPDDLEQPQFRTMLVNAMFWAMDRPVGK
jgi:type 1 glutamine amidotransferase